MNFRFFVNQTSLTSSDREQTENRQRTYREQKENRHEINKGNYLFLKNFKGNNFVSCDFYDTHIYTFESHRNVQVSVIV